MFRIIFSYSNKNQSANKANQHLANLCVVCVVCCTSRHFSRNYMYTFTNTRNKQHNRPALNKIHFTSYSRANVTLYTVHCFMIGCSSNKSSAQTTYKTLCLSAFVRFHTHTDTELFRNVVGLTKYPTPYAMNYTEISVQCSN